MRQNVRVRGPIDAARVVDGGALVVGLEEVHRSQSSVRAVRIVETMLVLELVPFPRQQSPGG